MPTQTTSNQVQTNHTCGGQQCKLNCSESSKCLQHHILRSLVVLLQQRDSSVRRYCDSPTLLLKEESSLFT